MVDPLTIIVIGDNLHLRSSLELLLRGLDHCVRTAASGEEGIRIIRQGPADLVICDIDLRGLVNSYGFARVLSFDSQAHGRPFLAALSDNSKQQDREMSAAAGFHRHLGKPFNVQDLELLIAEVRRYGLRKGFTALK